MLHPSDNPSPITRSGLPMTVIFELGKKGGRCLNLILIEYPNAVSFE